MNEKLTKAIEALKAKGNKRYCPFNLKEVNEVFKDNQVKNFCNDGCSVECPKFLREKLEKRLK